jgi:hypothetical protein
VAQSLAEYEAATLQKWTGSRLRVETRVKFFINDVLKKKNLSMAQRIKVATQLLRDKVATNLSRPVRKYKKDGGRDSSGKFLKGSKTFVDPQSRSKPGEFPRADTTRLMKDIFKSISDNGLEGRVGTTLKYGLILETRLDRSFLRRTLNEMRSDIIAILLHGHGAGPNIETGGF